MSETKDPRDEGCLCQRCGSRYTVDFMLPDMLWDRISGAFNLLCGWCIVELVEADPGRIEWIRLMPGPRKYARSAWRAAMENQS